MTKLKKKLRLVNKPHQIWTATQIWSLSLKFRRVCVSKWSLLFKQHNQQFSSTRFGCFLTKLITKLCTLKHTNHTSQFKRQAVNFHVEGIRYSPI